MKLTVKQMKARIEEIDNEMENLVEYGPEFNKLEKEAMALENILRRMPARKSSRMSASDREWQREQAMEAGMLHGVQGYNEVMGY